MSEFKIIIEKDQTKVGRYQLQLYQNNDKLFKPFTAGINKFADIFACAIKLKEMIEEDLKTEVPYAIIGIKEEINIYKEVDKELKNFIDILNECELNNKAILIKMV